MRPRDVSSAITPQTDEGASWLGLELNPDLVERLLAVVVYQRQRARPEPGRAAIVHGHHNGRAGGHVADYAGAAHVAADANLRIFHTPGIVRRDSDVGMGRVR